MDLVKIDLEKDNNLSLLAIGSWIEGLIGCTNTQNGPNASS